MNRTCAMLVALTAGLATGPVFGQKDVIKLGVSSKAQAALASAAEKDSALHNTELTKQQAETSRKIESVLADPKKKLQAALERQKQYAEFKKNYDQLSAAPKDAKFTSKEIQQRLAALQELYAKYQPMLDAAYQASGVDEKAVAAALTQQLGRNTKIHRKNLAFVILPWHAEDAVQEQPAPPTSFALTSPFTNRTLFEEASGNVATADADLSAGEFTVDAWGGLLGGSGKCRAVIGSFITVPPGYSKLRITADLEHYEDRSYVSVSVGAFGSASAHCRAVVQLTDASGSNSRKQYTFVDAYVSGGFESEFVRFDGPYSVTKTFNVSSNGGEYLIQAGGYSSIYCGTLGGFSTQSGARVKKISIEAQP